MTEVRNCEEIISRISECLACGKKARWQNHFVGPEGWAVVFRSNDDELSMILFEGDNEDGFRCEGHFTDPVFFAWLRPRPGDAFCPDCFHLD